MQIKQRGFTTVLVYDILYITIGIRVIKKAHGKNRFKTGYST